MVFCFSSSAPQLGRLLSVVAAHVLLCMHQHCIRALHTRMHRSLQEVLMLTARHVWGKWPRAVLLGKMVSRLETPSMTRDLTVTDHLQMCEDSQSRENTSVVTEHQMVEAVSCVEESTPQIAQLSCIKSRGS